jgi:integral membrane protein
MRVVLIAWPRRPSAEVVGTLTTVVIRAFQVAAYAEGALLPAILGTAVVHWSTGRAGTLVAIVGATHGAAFTVYVLLVPILARVVHWSPRTASVAFSVAFVPFAPWAFERHVRAELDRRRRLVAGAPLGL